MTLSEQLRLSSDNELNHGDFGPNTILLEAADELDRLTAQVAELKQELDLARQAPTATAQPAATSETKEAE